jgi:hypothetical protein
MGTACNIPPRIGPLTVSYVKRIAQSVALIVFHLTGNLQQEINVEQKEKNRL